MLVGCAAVVRGTVVCDTVVRGSIGGGVVALRRRDTGLFVLPGGKVEDGECPEDAVVREILEETGFDLSGVPYSFLGSVPHWVDGVWWLGMIYEFRVPFDSVIELREPDKFSDTEWLYLEGGFDDIRDEMSESMLLALECAGIR